MPCLRGHINSLLRNTLYFDSSMYQATASVQDVTLSFDNVTYLHPDHLGSTALTTNAQGAMVSEARFKPFGEERYTGGNTPSEFRFGVNARTENSLPGVGVGSVVDMNARLYSPILGRFLSADTIVPGPGNPQNLNRYAYGLGNPLRYTDPTGHRPSGDNSSECWPNCKSRPPVPPPPSGGGIGGGDDGETASGSATVSTGSGISVNTAGTVSVPRRGGAADSGTGWFLAGIAALAALADFLAKTGDLVRPISEEDQATQLWRGLSEKNPATGDFKPRPDDTDGLSFYLSREAAIAAGVPKPYFASLRAADLVKAGFQLEVNGGLPTPDGQSVYPAGHVSISRIDKIEWQSWYAWTDNKYAVMLRDMARASRNIVPR